MGALADGPGRPSSLSAASPVQPARRRALCVVLGALALACLLLYTPVAWSAYQDMRLRRMSPAELEAVVRREPRNLAARYRLGLAYGRENRHLAATRELLAVLQQEPTRADVLNDLGVSYLLQGRYYESLVALRGSLSARPDYATAYANLGRLHLATKMPFTATRELEHAARLDPKNVEILCDLGEAYHRTLNLKSAEAAYRQALKQRPRHVPAHVGLAKSYYGAARYDEAEKALLGALALAPDDPAALHTLGRMRLEQAASDAELKAGRELLERAGRADPQDPEVWYDIGRLLLRLRRPEEAVSPLRRALQLSREHAGATYQLARALRASGQSAEADRVNADFKRISLRSREQDRLEEHTRTHPHDWDSRARLAEIYIESGHLPLASLVCRQIHAGAPGHPRLPNLFRELARRGERPRDAQTPADASGITEAFNPESGAGGR